MKIYLTLLPVDEEIILDEPVLEDEPPKSELSEEEQATFV